MVVTLALVLGARVLAPFALRGLGAALIAEDPLAPADVLVVSNASAAAAFEAAALYRGGYAPRIFVPGTTIDPILPSIRALDIPYLSSSELARTVLERNGVPADVIAVDPCATDGTETEARTIAAYVARERPHRLIVVTARSHTARTGWLLRRLLPPDTVVIVRGAGADPYAAATWWQSRATARETFMECARWTNTLLGDLWRKG